MSVRRKSRALWAVVLCAALIALCWGLGIGRGEMAITDLEKDGLTFYRGGNKSYSLAGGDSYGVLNGGPGFTLPAGRYKLNVTIASDGDNALRIVSSNGAKAEPAELALPAQSWNNTLWFELKEDARDLELQIDFQQGTYLQIHGIDLVMLDRTDGTWTLTLIALLCCALYVLYLRGVLKDGAPGRLLLMGAAVLMASVPALRNCLYGGHDTLFHQMRLYNVADALGSGQFPVRMGGYGYNGYGSAVSIFYPDVFLLFPALMMRTGATVQCAVRTYIIAMNAVTAAAMYACGRRIFGSRTAGTCASILYTLASYRLMDVYVRDALGEYTAMAMLPLFVLGLWEAVFGDAKRWRTLTLGATLVFMSHMLTTALCAALAVAVCALNIGRIVRERRLAAILKATAAAVLVNLFLLVPMLDYSLQGIGDSGTLMTSCSESAMQVMELFVTQANAAKGVGCMLLLGLAALLYAALTGRAEGAGKRAALGFALAGAAAALMATELFPWAQLERLTRGLINYLQFPSRLLMFAELFLSLAGGYGAACLAKGTAHGELAALLTLVLCVTGVYGQIGGYAVQDEKPPEFGLRYDDPNIRFKSYTNVITGSYLEYTMPGSDPGATKDQSVALAGEAELTDYRKAGTRMTAQVNAQTDAVITLPVFGYDGYRAEVDGQRMETGLGENNRLTVTLPAGTRGELRVWFAGKMSWRIAEAVSLVTLLGLLAQAARRRGARKEKGDEG
ncbi:MAG: hypothetical protein ACI4MP_06275 [Candidatus Ventricola sp.]